MPTIEGFETVGRPIEQVWDFIADIENELHWLAGAVERHRLTAGPLAKGARFRRVDRFLGRTLDTEFEVTEFDPPFRFAARIVPGSAIAGTDQMTLEATERGTRVHFRADTQSFAGLFGRMADPLAARMLNRIVRTSLGNMRDLIEAQPE